MPPSLVILELSGEYSTEHKFTGGIPTEWGSLTKLKELKMVRCGLDGTFAHDPRYTGGREERTGERASSGTLTDVPVACSRGVQA